MKNIIIFIMLYIVYNGIIIINVLKCYFGILDISTMLINNSFIMFLFCILLGD